MNEADILWVEDFGEDLWKEGNFILNKSSEIQIFISDFF